MEHFKNNCRFLLGKGDSDDEDEQDETYEKENKNT